MTIFSELENFQTQQNGRSTAAWFSFLSKKMRSKQDHIKPSKFTLFVIPESFGHLRSESFESLK